MVNRPSVASIADANRKRFIGFRVLFNSRFYYPVLAVLFLDLGLSATQYTLLNFVWAIVIVVFSLVFVTLMNNLIARTGAPRRREV